MEASRTTTVYLAQFWFIPIIQKFFRWTMNPSSTLMVRLRMTVNVTLPNGYSIISKLLILR